MFAVRRPAPLVAFGLFVLLAPAEAEAWDSHVRRAVARVAAERIGENAVRRHRYMFGTGARLEDAMGWPPSLLEDRPEIETWRSITIPPNATRLDLNRDCAIGDCTPVKLRDTVGIVRLAVKDKASLMDAFRFMVNLALDLHQPLRAGYPPGNGGDETPVVVDGRPGTLFDYWERDLFAEDDEESLAARIREIATPERAEEWQAGSMKDWTWDTHLVAVRVAYGALPSGSPKQLDAAYAAQARSAAELQLAKAAVRLAALIDQVWP
jgi:hypothetical protein